MYNICDQIEAGTYATPSGREAELEGVRAMMRKFQRDTLAFHAAHPAYLALPKPRCEEADAPMLPPEPLEKAA